MKLKEIKGELTSIDRGYGWVTEERLREEHDFDDTDIFIAEDCGYIKKVLGKDTEYLPDFGEWEQDEYVYVTTRKLYE